MQKERREAIRLLLERQPFVSLEELSSMFPDVSEMTLRRDIEYFEKHGEAIKVRGGCRSMSFILLRSENGVCARSEENIPEKRAIAASAALHLETGRSIFIDSGSTMRMLVSLIPAKRYSFTTTDPAIALELSKIGTSVVNVVGGRLESDNQTVTGLQATRFLSGINIDIAFLSPSGFSTDSGFTVANFNECELKRIVVEKARIVIMLMDSSKYDRSLPYTFCTLADADFIITDSGSPKDLTAIAAKYGTRVVFADV